MIKEGKGKTDFHLDIQYTNPPLLGHVFHGLGAGTVVIPPELRMLNEPPFLYQRQEFLLRCEVVLSTILFA